MSDNAFSINSVSLVHHLLQLVITHCLTKFSSDDLKILEGYVILVLTEKNKGLIQFFISISFTHLSGHDVKETIEINSDLTLVSFLFFSFTLLLSLIQIRNQSFNFFSSWFKTKSSEGNLKIRHFN